MKRKLIVSFAIGVLVVAAILGLAFSSPEYRLVRAGLSGAEMSQRIGGLKHHFMTSFKFSHRDEQTKTTLTMYVIGSRKSGWLNVSLERENGSPKVISAFFDGLPVELH